MVALPLLGLGRLGLRFGQLGNKGSPGGTPIYRAPLTHSLVDDVSGITAAFTRNTNETVKDYDKRLRTVGATGYLGVSGADVPAFRGARYVRNYCLYSQDVSVGTWTKTQINYTNNAVTAPDGTTTAFKLYEDTNNGHLINQVTPLTAKIGDRTCYSLYCAPAENDYIMLRMTGVYSGSVYIGFKISTYTAIDIGGPPPESYGAEPASLTMPDAPAGWIRIWATCVATAAGTVNFGVYTSRDGIYLNRNYTGNGVNGHYNWGLQVEDVTGARQTSPAEHQPTTSVLAARAYNTSHPYVTNLLKNSQALDDWSDTATATVQTANYATAPDGTLTADLIEDDNAAAYEGLYSNTVTVTPGADYTSSIYIKKDAIPASTRFCAMRMLFSGGAAPWVDLYFDTSTGETNAKVVVNSGTIVASGETGEDDDYWRFYLTVNAGSSTALQIYLYPAVGANADLETISHTITGSFIGWGVQCEDVTNLASYKPAVYVPTTTKFLSALRTARTNIAPSSMPGIQRWNTRVNECQYSEDLTSWASSGTPTLTTSSRRGPDGKATAFDLGDDDAAAFEYKQSIAVTVADNEAFTASVFVGKDAVAKTTRYGNLRMVWAGGTQSNTNLYFDTSTGEILADVTTGSATVVGSGVEDWGSHWRFWLCTQNDASGNTSLTWRLYPAYGASATLGTASSAATGTLTAVNCMQLEDTTGKDPEPGPYIANLSTSTTTRDGGTLTIADGTIVLDTVGMVDCKETPDITGNPVAHRCFVTLSAAVATNLLYQHTGGNITTYDGTTTAQQGLTKVAGTEEHIGARWSAAANQKQTGTDGAGGGTIAAYDGTFTRSNPLQIGSINSGANAIQGCMKDLTIYAIYPDELTFETRLAA